MTAIGSYWCNDDFARCLPKSPKSCRTALIDGPRWSPPVRQSVGSGCPHLHTHPWPARFPASSHAAACARESMTFPSTQQCVAHYRARLLREHSFMPCTCFMLCSLLCARGIDISLPQVAARGAQAARTVKAKSLWSCPCIELYAVCFAMPCLEP